MEIEEGGKREKRGEGFSSKTNSDASSTQISRTKVQFCRGGGRGEIYNERSSVAAEHRGSSGNFKSGRRRTSPRRVTTLHPSRAYTS